MTNDEKKREVVFVVAVMIVSMFVHELGHLIAGLCVGYSVESLIISPYRMGVRFTGILNPTSNLIMLLAGGVAQGLFLLYMSRYHKALIVGALFFFIYALFEGGLI